MTVRALSLATLLSLIPSFAFAQDDEEMPPDPAPAAKTEEKKDDASATETTPAATVESAPQERFKIKRGFYAQADLGVYMTFMGRNTNNPAFPKRFTSNVQPHVGVVAGYDVVSSDSFNLGLGARFAMGLSGGAGRVSDAELMGEDIGTKSNDFSVIELGAEADLAIMMTDRVWLNIKLDGGAGIVDPDPTKVAGEDGAGAATFAPVFGAGVGVEYFTLLNDFSVGATLRFQGVLADGMIPGMSITIPIKYTF
jgi:hypothetical protein